MPARLDALQLPPYTGQYLLVLSGYGDTPPTSLELHRAVASSGAVGIVAFAQEVQCGSAEEDTGASAAEDQSAPTDLHAADTAQFDAGDSADCSPERPGRVELVVNLTDPRLHDVVMEALRRESRRQGVPLHALV